MVYTEEKNTSMPTGVFERLYFTDEEYHSTHPMLQHRHKTFAELIYVLGGNGSYRVDKRMYDLKAGNLLIVDKNVWHGEEPFRHEHNTTITVAIRDLKLDGRDIRLIESNKRAVVEFEPGGAVEKLMVALFDLSKTTNRDPVLYNNIVNSILNVVYTKLLEVRGSEDGVVEKNDELIRVISEYLDEHYEEPMSLSEIGERFGISQYYLAHLFKSETGVSPMKYVMHRKIGEVQNLLMNTDLSVKEIGERLGFSSSCHLSTVFKKYFGISPKVYRQNFRENGQDEIENHILNEIVVQAR